MLVPRKSDLREMGDGDVSVPPRAACVQEASVGAGPEWHCRHV